MFPGMNQGPGGIVEEKKYSKLKQKILCCSFFYTNVESNVTHLGPVISIPFFLASRYNLSLLFVLKNLFTSKNKRIK
jgi:hypothetical protein